MTGVRARGVFGALVALVAASPARAEPGAAAVESFHDAASADVARAAAEMAGGPAAVTVSVQAGAGAAPAASRVARALAERITRGVHSAAAPVALRIDAELRVDAVAGTVSLTARLRRPELTWKQLLSLPTNRWVRVVTTTRPLDPELRRALGVAPRGPRLHARPRRLELDLGAPVLALAAPDLDGDGRAELVALTSDEVVLLEVDRTKLTARQRVPLAGDAPVPRPREPIGALAAADLDGDGTPELLARSSEHDAGARLAYRAGALVSDGGFADYPLCASGAATRGLPLAPGRNVYLVPRLGEAAGLACTAPRWQGLVDAGGAFTLRDGPATVLATTGVGAAFALVDLDGDGVPELAASAHRAPGKGDVLTVLAAGAGGKPEERWKSDLLSGGIVAVTGGDTDGDGAADLVFAARLVGSTRTDVWIVR